MKTKRGDKMKVNKGMRAFCLLLFMTLLGAVFVPVVSADEQKNYDGMMIQVDPKTDTEGFLPVDVISIDPEVKSATPYYPVLILSESGKKNFLQSIESNVDKNDYDEIEEFLNQLWTKYQIISKTKPGDAGYPTYGGSITYFQFSDNVKGLMLKDDENKKLESIQTIINNESKESSITPKYSASTHGRISYWAAYKCLFPYPSTVESSADEPDYFYEWAPYPFDQIFHSLSHYYNPTYGIGGAPQATSDHLNAAISYYSLGSSYYADAAYKLGYSSHFIEDVGNPMHTGGEAQQILNQWTHNNYEGHVTVLWDSQFEPVVSNNSNYYWMSNWEQGTIDNAEYSNGYLDTLYQRVYNLGSGWD